MVANRVNIVCNGPPALVRQVTDGYRRDWAAAGHSADDLPLMGMTRTIVVAESDGEALAIARRAHRRWHQSFMKLWDKHGTRPINAFYPDNFDEAQQMGFGIAGTPATVRDCAGAAGGGGAGQLPRLPPRLRRHGAGGIARARWSCSPST